jgi:Zn-dependent protease with chaperone function
MILFTKHMRIKSRSYNKNKRSFSINPFAPHSSRIRKILFEFEFVHLESGLFYLLLIYFILIFFIVCLFYSLFHFDFLSLSFYSLPSFLKSHRFVDPVESDPFSRRAKGTKDLFFDQK